MDVEKFISVCTPTPPLGVVLSLLSDGALGTSTRTRKTRTSSHTTDGSTGARGNHSHSKLGEYSYSKRSIAISGKVRATVHRSFAQSTIKLCRMKSKPEYQHVFSSPAMLYRAFYTISTQHYRLLVRRYILDLFTIELDHDVVENFSECSKSLRAPPSFKPPKSPSNRVISMLGRLGPSRRGSESDDDDDLIINEEDTIVKQVPAISLQPMSKIVGFAI
jgi:hypothetical protein